MPAGGHSQVGIVRLPWPPLVEGREAGVLQVLGQAAHRAGFGESDGEQGWDLVEGVWGWERGEAAFGRVFGWMTEVSGGFERSWRHSCYALRCYPVGVVDCRR
jgi:hypothetical protein